MGTASDPFTTLSDAYTTPLSGRYYFDLGSGVFQADVDTSEGGGWVLILQYVHQGGTNPALSIKGGGADFPAISSAPLGNDESSDSTRWGHAGNVAMSQFTGDIELRWYGQTSNHNRIIHFRSTIGDDYIRSGTGNFDGIETDFTALTGHSANVPASKNARYIDKNDYALTNFPYYTGGNYHWGVRGHQSNGTGANGNRWEVDDVSTTSNTIHRIWVRQANPLEVTNTNNIGEGSLHQAIHVANSNSALDDITFAIPGSGPHRITATTIPPNISDSGITIDGITQSGASCGDLWNGIQPALQIEWNANNQTSYSVARVFGDNITVRGLSLTGGRTGGYVDAASDNVVFQCNYFGITPSGVKSANERGIEIHGSSTLVGGSNGGEGNVVSGNATGVVTMAGSASTSIIGNFIGTNPAGSNAITNANGAITHDTGSGSWNVISTNLISGNGASGGIYLTSNDSIAGSSGDVMILGNYIGTDRSGSSAISNGAEGIRFDSGSISGVVVGGSSASERNIISGNTGGGVWLNNVSDITLLGNYIGLTADGSTALGNTSHGIEARAVTGLTIGGTGAGDGNIVSGNPGSGTEGIWLDDGTVANLFGNYIGTDSTGTLDRGNGDEGIVIQDGSNAIIGDGTAAGRNVIAGNGGANIYVPDSSANGGYVDVNGNLIGVGVNGEVLGGEDGIHFWNVSTSTSSLVRANTIAHHNWTGIRVRNNSSRVAMIENSIFSNGRLGIHLGTDFTDAVAANDIGDTDSGPNNLLNYPVLRSIAPSGGNVSYSIDLDAPANTEGYRIDFYNNTTIDPTGHGEGETWLGFVNTSNHAGGLQNFTGTFTPNVTIAVSDRISATATRMTGAASYAETSEFSATILGGIPEISVLLSSSVYDPTSADLKALPGNDMIYQMIVTNTGDLPVDTDNLVVIADIPTQASFFNAATPEFGNSIFSFDAGTSGLTFTPASDARFSNSVTRPTEFSDCSYSPIGGYDPAVTFVCLNPKGSMLAGSNQSFTMRYRVTIQ